MAIMIGTTTATRDEARSIAQRCVLDGFAACAHIDEIESVFLWNGETQSGTEFRVFLKTIEASFEAIAGIIRELHSYDEPAIFTIPITGGSSSYLSWIEAGSSS